MKVKNKYEIRGDHISLFIRKRNGELVETLIDADDLEKIQQVSQTWYIVLENNDGYVYGNIYKNGTRKRIPLHRWVMDEPKGLVIDHINGDIYDNRKSNLRAVTQLANMQNKHKPRNNGSSGIRGVYYNKRTNKWIAAINPSGKTKYLGSFDNIEDADKAAKEARAIYFPYSPEWREKNNA